jgi:hypothetical protein
MGPSRKKLSAATEAAVLIKSRRRCCLCVFLHSQEELRKGQIAHLNHDPSDSELSNLVYLCFDHHDEYDGRTSQAKGFTEREVRHWRDRLIEKYATDEQDPNIQNSLGRQPVPDAFDQIASEYAASSGNMKIRQWRFPLWQVPDTLEFFAYKASNGADGVCLIERIDLPDGRVVIACIQVPGNPGNSITNSVEYICSQVCERFEIDPKLLVWLEHYDDMRRQDWDIVTFDQMPPISDFGKPRWNFVTPDMWSDLKLKPKDKIQTIGGALQSKLTKLFEWPPRQS